MSQHCHVVGVAGVGMSALAEALLGVGYDVSGSDRSLDQGRASDVLERLARAGLRCLPQDGSALRPDTVALVVSTAIEEDNPEIQAARRLGLPIVHRADMLARLAAGHRLVAITGTAGKTTVTGLVGFLLEQCGQDPTVVDGGQVLNWIAPDRTGSVRRGRSDLWVIEADESDRSLLRFHPETALITNVSKDHFELEDVQRLFRAFAGQVTGPVLTGPGVASSLGLEARELQPEVRRTDQGWTFVYAGRVFPSPMVGRHNAENAFLAVALCHELGCPLDALQEALPRFAGMHRRLETVGVAGGVTVIDDYAHNPAKLEASWRAVAETHARVLGFWRPHGFAPLKLMQHELADAFTSCLRPDDALLVLPVFYAGGTAQKSITSEEWVATLRARGLPAFPVVDYEDLLAQLLRRARPGDAVVGMGARDPDLPIFARHLVQVLQQRSAP